MASTPVTLTRTAYTQVAAAADVVSVSLPELPFRVGRGDAVELISVAAANVPTGTDIPEVGAALRSATLASVVLQNSKDQFAVITNFTVPTGETLYGRWLGLHEYAAADDLYVVKF